MYFLPKLSLLWLTGSATAATVPEGGSANIRQSGSRFSEIDHASKNISPDVWVEIAFAYEFPLEPAPTISTRGENLRPLCGGFTNPYQWSLAFIVWGHPKVLSAIGKLPDWRVDMRDAVPGTWELCRENEQDLAVTRGGVSAFIPPLRCAHRACPR